MEPAVVPSINRNISLLFFNISQLDKSLRTLPFYVWASFVALSIEELRSRLAKLVKEKLVTGLIAYSTLGRDK
jgi:hypothetical protein